MGAPNNPAFQRQVLITLLGLLERTDGPVILDDYPVDAPESDEEVAVLSCPVRFDNETVNETDPLKSSFLREIQAMRPWYDLGLEKRGRTTLGGSGLDIDNLGEFIYAFIEGKTPDNPRPEVGLSVTLKIAIEDLKAYYMEGVTAQPGQNKLSSMALKKWFWNTTAGEVLVQLIKVFSERNNEDLKLLASRYIAPMDILIERGVVKVGL